LGKHQIYEQKTEELITPILEKYQYELVDVEFVKEAGSWHLCAYIDKEGGITIDDLTTVNHELSDLLDENDYIEETYILEVSSPGLLRPFKKPKDFIRNIGNDVELKLFSPITWEENGKKYTDKEFIGILKAYDEENAKVQIGLDNRDIELFVKEIALIRKLVEF
jgi:ribosome maturation factor RimP